MATTMQVSKSTIVDAYDRLAAEGAHQGSQRLRVLCHRQSSSPDPGLGRATNRSSDRPFMGIAAVFGSWRYGLETGMRLASRFLDAAGQYSPRVAIFIALRVIYLNGIWHTTRVHSLAGTSATTHGGSSDSCPAGSTYANRFWHTVD